MTAPPHLLNMAEVAERLGIALQTFYGRHHTLRRQHGFPAPVPGLGRRWDPEAIEHWLALQRPMTAAETEAALAGPQPANDIERWHLEMDRRAAALAISGRR